MIEFNLEAKKEQEELKKRQSKWLDHVEPTMSALEMLKIFNEHHAHVYNTPKKSVHNNYNLGNTWVTFNDLSTD